MLFAAGVVPNLAAAAERKPARSIGLQLYTVRTLLELDFEGTLAKVADLGYREVEFAGIVGSSVSSTSAILKRTKLSAPSSHASYETLETDLPQTLQAAAQLGQQFIVCPFLQESQRRSADDWKRICRRLNAIGEQAQRAGLRFAYHNHDFEFTAIDGRTPYDIVLSETDPDLVKMEMDLYWVTKAGRDPVSYFRLHPGRFPLVHLKDMARDGTITDLGKGIIDFKRILGFSALAGIEHYYVEHDNPDDPMRSIETSLKYAHEFDIE